MGMGETIIDKYNKKRQMPIVDWFQTNYPKGSVFVFAFFIFCVVITSSLLIAKQEEEILNNNIDFVEKIYNNHFSSQAKIFDEQIIKVSNFVQSISSYHVSSDVKPKKRFSNLSLKKIKDKNFWFDKKDNLVFLGKERPAKKDKKLYEISSSFLEDGYRVLSRFPEALTAYFYAKDSFIKIYNKQEKIDKFLISNFENKVKRIEKISQKTNKRHFWTGMYYDEFLGIWVASKVVEFYIDDKLSGYYIIDIPVNTIFPYLKKLGAVEGGALYLLSQEGFLIASSFDKDVLNMGYKSSYIYENSDNFVSIVDISNVFQNKVLAPIKSKIFENIRGSAKIVVNEKPYLLSWKRSVQTEWLLISVAPFFDTGIHSSFYTKRIVYLFLSVLLSLIIFVPLYSRYLKKKFSIFAKEATASLVSIREIINKTSQGKEPKDVYISSLIEVREAMEDVYYKGKELWRTYNQLQAREELIDKICKRAKVSGILTDRVNKEFVFSYNLEGLLDADEVDTNYLKVIYQYCSKEYADEMVPKLRKALDEGDNFDVVIPITTSSGQRRWHRLIMERFITDDDSQKMALGVIQDITEYKEISDEWELVFERTPDIVCVLSLQTLRFTKVNPSFLELFGWSKTEVFESEIYNFVHKDDMEVVRRRVARLYRDGVVKEEIIRTRKFDGTYRWISWSGYSDEFGENAYLIGHDITDRIVVENELREKERQLTRFIKEIEDTRTEAEEANLAKSEFLSMMSHELKTPMTGIIGITDLLLSSQLDGVQKEHVSILKESTESLKALLENILYYSKLETGKIEIEKNKFSLRELIDSICTLYKKEADDKGLVISYEIEENIDDSLIGDDKRIRQVFFYLLSNAIKFTKEGEVKLTVNKLEQKLEDVYKLRFAVKDTGIGIAKEKIQRVFDPFEQAEKTISRNYGGAGLGLPICQSVVEAMGGIIGVDSEVEKGTTFWFELDLFSQETSGKGYSSGKNSGGTSLEGIKVLLAEDSKTNRYLVIKVLEKMGLKVDGVENGQEAVERAKSEKYDIILMDIHMPIMDGLTAAKRIREVGENMTTPIIALTADSFEGKEKQYDNAGIASVVAKPINWRKLAVSILSHTGKLDP